MLIVYLISDVSLKINGSEQGTLRENQKKYWIYFADKYLGVMNVTVLTWSSKKSCADRSAAVSSASASFLPLAELTPFAALGFAAVFAVV